MTYTLEQLKDAGYEHGWVFGKYTQQIKLDDDLQLVLDSSKQGIMSYMQGYNDGFKAGFAEAFRPNHHELDD